MVKRIKCTIGIHFLKHFQHIECELFCSLLFLFLFCSQQPMKEWKYLIWCDYRWMANTIMQIIAGKKATLPYPVNSRDSKKFCFAAIILSAVLISFNRNRIDPLAILSSNECWNGLQGILMKLFIASTLFYS